MERDLLFYTIFFTIGGIVSIVYIQWKYERHKKELFLDNPDVPLVQKIVKFTRHLVHTTITIDYYCFTGWRVSFAPYKYSNKLHAALPLAGTVVEQLASSAQTNFHLVKLDSDLPYKGFVKDHIVITPMLDMGEVEPGKKYIMIVYLIPPERMDYLQNPKGLNNMGHAMMYNITGQEPAEQRSIRDLS